MLDFLIEEVLQRQAEPIQQFLVQTAILERLCGPLCDAVTATSGDGQAILERLERDNLFIVPLDDHHGWFRYHHLFSDLLRQRLVRTQPELIAGLHRSASQWYATAGLLDEAIEHALVAGEMLRAAALVEKAAEATFMRSEAADLYGLDGSAAPIRARSISRPGCISCLGHAVARSAACGRRAATSAGGTDSARNRLR